jgi:hypothetical protein
MVWTWLRKVLTHNCSECLVHKVTHYNMCEACYIDWRDEMKEKARCLITSR